MSDNDKIVDELSSNEDETDTDNIQWTNYRPSWSGEPVVHRFTVGSSGIKQIKTPTINNCW